MYRELAEYISEIKSRFDTVPKSRKKDLRNVADFIRQNKNDGKVSKLNFICTHNSRRSHLAQIWTTVAAHYYGIHSIGTYSGGTEATAFNPRAVAALERIGFQIENPGGENPKYRIKFANDADPIICFSKTFGHEGNPDKEFAAIMTCSDADSNCPVVPGAEFRKAITYRDPKEADGTGKEKETYDERCKQIATEMFFMLKEVHNG